VEEGAGKAADSLEAEALPEEQGALVGLDYEIELHGVVASLSGVFERMGAHGSSDSFAGEGRGGDVAAVGYVGAAALLIGAEVVGADDLASVFGHEDFMVVCEPIRQSRFARHVAPQGVGVSGADDRFDDGPDGDGVAKIGRADGEHGAMIRNLRMDAKELAGDIRVGNALGSVVADFWRFDAGAIEAGRGSAGFRFGRRHRRTALREAGEPGRQSVRIEYD